ncbi:S8 family serine peptidase [Lysobacter yananisis]|uniref:S8 family serine peptidase n=1 Tax=Lysobacter yananisis TaxID=1003114 RepID=A0ABY9PBK6_9GAMM|nr:S8 family serine peptidase [Lysobacter yananisis]WMT04445.1 S8 family serine peptidase [Lysobacter yananisis]
MRQTILRTSALAVALLGATAAQAQNDPLYRYQWHLMNYGQAVLGDTRPAFGIDMGIDDLHDYNIRGRGVVVSVVDQGVEIAHPDLVANVVPNGSWNFNDGSHDPTPVSGGSSHGTMVAGIVAAVGWNGIGGRGVAPAARLKSFNYLDAASTTAQLQYAWWDGAESKDVSVVNNSFGSTAVTIPAFSENEVQAYEGPMSATRNGLGAVYVKSAGNDFISDCPKAVVDANVGCKQTGLDRRNNMFNVMTIAAVNAAGKRSSYSSAGAALWVSGLGGEYGRQVAYSPGYAAVSYNPAIVTTDLSGCARGSNVNGNVRNALSTDASAIDNTCNYVGTMNGTSAAAPTVAGVAALMLQANPKLSFRDVRYILATTARQLDPAQPAATHANGTVLVPGWTRNAAGRSFSNWYGYGLVDAALAVEVAGKAKPLPRLVDSGWQRIAPTDAVAIGGAGAPAKLQIAIGNDIRKVESVQLGFASNYAHASSTVPFPVQVTLVSPSGTRSTVFPAMTRLNTAAFKADFLASNAFLDETGQGTWTLEVADVPLADGAASKGALASFKIRVLGH